MYSTDYSDKSIPQPNDTFTFNNTELFKAFKTFIGIVPEKELQTLVERSILTILQEKYKE